MTNQSHGNDNGARLPHQAPVKPSDLTQRILPEDLFLGLLCLERKRSERSGRKFFLLILDGQAACNSKRREAVIQGMVRSVNASKREADPAGWYRRDAVLGLIIADFGASCDCQIEVTVGRVRQTLASQLKTEDLRLVQVCLYAFSNESDDAGSGGENLNLAFYPDLQHRHSSMKLSLILKRTLDILGSLTMLLMLSPLFALLGFMVKMTSKGPILFRQQRVGQYGVPFKLLKFRSMQALNDNKIHEDYIRQFISGSSDAAAGKANHRPVYKITDDPRVTWFGKFMRRTSLDELPQFWNVLVGEMSLVGPRPSLAYETERYGLWHRRRLLETKPGITGLWQVRGRSRTTFDEMVRMDLRYCREWSPLLDVQILLQTPWAVFLGDGAC
jgi:lipopolysaccharide/colanic/teichoic acid biosynthesis glycosyltransferase